MRKYLINILKYGAPARDNGRRQRTGLEQRGRGEGGARESPVVVIIREESYPRKIHFRTHTHEHTRTPVGWVYAYVCVLVAVSQRTLPLILLINEKKEKNI